MVVIAAPNGSGKTMLTRYLSEAGLHFHNYQNADDRAAHRLQNREGKHEPDVPPPSRTALMAAHASFSYETVLASPAHVTKLRIAREQGYFVRLIYVATDDPDICVARVADRVAKGGHNIASDRIRRDYQVSLHECLIAAVRLADECLIFDNSSGAGGQPLRVAHIIGKYVRCWPNPALSWPEACLFRADHVQSDSD
jgi:predicted ABC-type ATPase